MLDAAELEPDDLLARVREQTGGRGADIVLDCSGVPETFVTSLRMTRVGGTVVEAGAFVDMGPVEINPNADICSRNVAVLGHRRRDGRVLRAGHGADDPKPRSTAAGTLRDRTGSRSKMHRAGSSSRNATRP